MAYLKINSHAMLSLTKNVVSVVRRYAAYKKKLAHRDATS